jgi:drug/metabolite transporter (DMT)-like permease
MGWIMNMKKWFPAALIVLGCCLLGMSQLLGQESGPDEVIGHIAGMIMSVGSVICIGAGLVLQFLKNDDEEEAW